MSAYTEFLLFLSGTAAIAAVGFVAGLISGRELAGRVLADLSTKISDFSASNEDWPDNGIDDIAVRYLNLRRQATAYADMGRKGALAWMAFAFSITIFTTTKLDPLPPALGSMPIAAAFIYVGPLSIRGILYGIVRREAKAIEATIHGLTRPKEAASLMRQFQLTIRKNSENR